MARMSETGVGLLLDPLDLSEYTENFVSNGYDGIQDLCEIDQQDLDIMRIDNEDHREKIISAASSFSSRAEYPVFRWLEEHGLSQYCTNFIHNDYLDLEDIGRLEIELKLYDDLEIVLPGHRKRLKRAVTQLRKRRRLSSEAEDPVAQGQWRKPKKLQDAKNPFLCIDASIKSTKENAKKLDFEFMVDSGSDVATITEAALKELDLELLGTVQSRGVHATKPKQLYKAKLVIGEEEIDTEVMAEEYESIGNHVLRHFRHYINGSRHFWLKGDHPRLKQVAATQTEEQLPLGATSPGIS